MSDNNGNEKHHLFDAHLAGEDCDAGADKEVGQPQAGHGSTAKEGLARAHVDHFCRAVRREEQQLVPEEDTRKTKKRRKGR